MIHHNPNIAQKEHLEKLPKFTQSALDTVLADVNLKISESRAEAKKMLSKDRPADISLEQGAIYYVRSLADCMITAGFGVGVIIASNATPTSEQIQALDSQFKNVISFEEVSRARILGIKRRDEAGNVDVRAEPPGWGKTVGATLPVWGNSDSNQKMSLMIVDQIKADYQIIANFKNAPTSDPNTVSEVFSKLLQLEFLVGVMEGLIYAKPSDFSAFKHEFKRKSPKTGEDVFENIPTFFRGLKAAIEKKDISVPIGMAIAGK